MEDNYNSNKKDLKQDVGEKLFDFLNTKFIDDKGDAKPVNSDFTKNLVIKN